jgi:hypothetical protein
VEDEELTQEELKERKIMKLLLKVKNGTPPQRKSALRQLTDKARDLGAEALFNQILPLLMSPTLEDQERHLLVKVRFALYRFQNLGQPWNVFCCSTFLHPTGGRLVPQMLVHPGLSLAAAAGSAQCGGNSTCTMPLCTDSILRHAS